MDLASHCVAATWHVDVRAWSCARGRIAGGCPSESVWDGSLQHSRVLPVNHCIILRARWNDTRGRIALQPGGRGLAPGAHGGLGEQNLRYPAPPVPPCRIAHALTLPISNLDIRLKHEGHLSSFSCYVVSLYQE